VFEDSGVEDWEVAMTVAPELPPAPVTRRGGSGRLRVVVDRTPAGVVALVEPPRPRGPVTSVLAPVVVPAPPVEPGIGREHHSADPAPPHLRPPTRTLEPPAATRVVSARPVGSRPVGARVVRPAPGHLRLTRRGRLVTAAATLLIAVLAVVGAVARVGALHETAPLPASAPAQIVVAPGETLWSIAERVAPDRDPRTVVAGIQRLNDLPTPDVHAGQTLLLRTP
jgi:LysM repeat protein